MEQMRGKEVADFARHSRLTKEERAQIAAKQKEEGAEPVPGDEDLGDDAPKPKSKRKTEKAEAKPKAPPGTNWMPLIVGLVLIGGGGGGAYYYLSHGKKKTKKRRPAVAVGGDDAPDFGAMQAPAAPQVKKRQNVK